ncbi:MAG: hypothetical protein IJO98_10125 [Clostridia bacterium]|nr:hypothetical protein [Clostridia bacterium]
MIASLDSILGKTFLVGITDYDKDGNAVSQIQFFGRVETVYKNGIRIRCSDGSEYMLPPDLSSTHPAPKGSYRLRSKGEVIENPDYLSTWNRIKDGCHEG